MKGSLRTYNFVRVANASKVCCKIAESSKIFCNFV